MDFYTNVTRFGNKLLVRGYQKGKPKKMSINYRPNLYVLSKTPTSHRTIDGRYLEPVNLDSMSGARKFKEKYDGIAGFEVHGYDKWMYNWISDRFQGEIKYDPSQIKIATLDIECECENGFPDPLIAMEKVNAISIKPFGKDTIVLGYGEWNHNQDNVIYIPCGSETDLLMKFIKVWRELNLDIVTGWNVDSFDITYLCNRIDRILGENEHRKLSPWGSSETREFTTYGYQKNVNYTLHGINIIDYLELYKKNTFVNQESYKLDHIAKVELGKQKLDYSEYGSLHMLYQKNYEKFLEYNIRDVVLVEELEDKLGLMELIMSQAYTAKCNFNDTFGMVKYWETIIYNFLKERGIQMPPKKIQGEDKSKQIIGAYVKEPHVGKHDWVVSFDLNSLYPHLIMQYNISPETMQKGSFGDASVKKLLNKECDLTYLKKQNLSMAANGAMFSREKQGFLPELMETFYDERKMWKKRMIEYQKEKETTTDVKRLKELDTLIKRAYNNQQVRKIALNSAYGALANRWFAFFSVPMAEGITTSGQLSIQWAEKQINNYLQGILGDDKDRVIAIDTDSVYITLDDLVQQVFPEETDKQKIITFIDTVANTKIKPIIDEGYEELAEYVNAYQQKMEMGREVIADRGVWTAKKRYILNVHDNEGVRLAKPKLKMMGIETAKSSTPQWVRTKLEEGFKVAMTGTEQELWDFVENARDEFKTLPPEVVAFPRGVRNLKQYTGDNTVYRKSTPIHVRGSLLFNHLLEEKNLKGKYETIKEGEKIHFCYLTLPNPINENVIGFVGELPKEFDLHKFTDYDMQFNKAFLEPLRVVVHLMGWNTEPTASLDSFFA